MTSNRIKSSILRKEAPHVDCGGGRWGPPARRFPRTIYRVFEVRLSNYFPTTVGRWRVVGDKSRRRTIKSRRGNCLLWIVVYGVCGLWSGRPSNSSTTEEHVRRVAASSGPFSSLRILPDLPWYREERRMSLQTLPSFLR